MKLSRAKALAWIVLLIGGCRTPDPTVELLESELRWMEDQLYYMDEQLKQSCAQLASCRNNNAALRNELERAQDKPADSAADRADDRDSTADEEQLFDLTPPVIEQGEPADTLRSSPEDDLPDAIAVPPVIEMPEPVEDSRPTGPMAEPDPFSAGTPSSATQRVARIKLNRQLTGGYDLDDTPGDEGVMVVIEPQDAEGQYVALAGNVTVSVTDPEQSGMASRVGNWEFDEVQTAGCLKETLLGRGIHLQLPWPAESPHGKRLRLEVSFSTVDGRRLTAEQDIKVDPIGSTNEFATQSTRARPWTASRSGEAKLDAQPLTGRTAPSDAASLESERPRPSIADRPVWKPHR